MSAVLKNVVFSLARLEETEYFAAQCAEALAKTMEQTRGLFVIFLSGDLGAGKTTWVRALLRAWGYQDRVPSPTFNVVLHYMLPTITVHHLDAYRLRGVDELLALGPADWDEPGHLLIVEWPENLGHWGEWHQPDWHFTFGELSDNDKVNKNERQVKLEAKSDNGTNALSALLRV